MYRRPDPTDWMWAQACDLIAQAERMHRQFFRLAGSATTQTTWEPPVDVFEDDREIVIVVAMPGVVAERVTVSRDAGVLSIAAERPLPLTGTGHAVRRLEIPYGRFERRLVLPATPLILETPELSLGCLIVRLKKT
ncbi:MAG TPA: Hsp20/alpha crystallin family protein [Casimicrobiaceae bacterium]|nr:Hsp20/alpha crystallin family protein [Casimicrobiaceae bacterium]